MNIQRIRDSMVMPVIAILRVLTPADPGQHRDVHGRIWLAGAVGAGTVLSVTELESVRTAGGRLVVSVHSIELFSAIAAPLVKRCI